MSPGQASLRSDEEQGHENVQYQRLPAIPREESGQVRIQLSRITQNHDVILAGLPMSSEKPPIGTYAADQEPRIHPPAASYMYPILNPQPQRFVALDDLHVVPT
jgi:hypothetical protein